MSSPFILQENPVSLAPTPYFSNYTPSTPIAIDFGLANVRVGLTSFLDPQLNFASVVLRFKPRNLSQTLTFVGNDCYLDPSLRSGLRRPYDGPLMANWDCVENILDFLFLRLGVNGASVDNPIVMNEPLAVPKSQRENTYQLLFEAYNVPKVAFGLSDLFSFHYNSSASSGLVIGCGNQSTHVIPIINNKPLLSYSKRINWGGELCADYLGRSLALKYPFFPSRLTSHQFKTMFQEFSYFSDNYTEELERLMDLDFLDRHDIVVEAPFTEVVHAQKSAEELERQHARRVEQGKRLQEQAQKTRLEKLVQKEADLQYYTEMKERLFDKKVSKKQILQTLRAAGFDDEQDFKKYLAGLEKLVRRARNQDIGEDDGIVPVFDLLDIRDEDLTEEQLKKKRQQKMQKANYEARKRVRAEKEIQKKKREEQEAREAERRKTDLQGWIAEKRAQLKVIVDRKKQRQKMRDELSNRKSHAAQVRMRNIASLAADGTRSGAPAQARPKRPKKVTIDNDPNDTFGANDDDWLIYRDIALLENEEELENEDAELQELEAALLKYDPDFRPEDVFGSELNWKKLTMHKFLRGARPYDPEDQHQQHQMHLNVERIKVPEVFIQPSIAGLDQVGIADLLENLIVRRLPSENFYHIKEGQTPEIVKNVFLTGGCSLIKNFKGRIVKEFTLFLPEGTTVGVQMASDPILDPWRGMRKWAGESNEGWVSRREWEEMGGDYIKEHRLGNVV